MFKKPSKAEDEKLPTALEAAKSQRGKYLSEVRPLFFEQLHAHLFAHIFTINAQLREPNHHLLLDGDHEKQNILLRQNDEKWFSKGISYEIGVGTFSGELLETHRRPKGTGDSQDKLFLWTSWRGLLVITTHREDYDSASYATYFINKYVEDAKLPCKPLDV